MIGPCLLLLLLHCIFNICCSAASFSSAATISYNVKILNMNVWGIRYYSDMKQERFAGIEKFLQSSNYDVIFLQELWSLEDYQALRKKYQYGTQHGSPGSLTCPATTDNGFHFLHISPLDCNGLTILSKHPIIDTSYSIKL